MRLSKDTITEFIDELAERKRRWEESPDRVKFVIKLEKVYAFLSMHKNWAYSLDELSSALNMSRRAVKSVVKLLKKLEAVEERVAGEDKYYMYVKEMDVLREYRKMLIRKWKGWRLEPQEIAEELKRKGLEYDGEISAS